MTAILSLTASTLVGCVFLLTGMLKVFAPTGMVAHFRRMELMPWRYLRILTRVAAVGESVLGVALIARVFPSSLFPATLAIVIAFAAFTAWSAIAKKAEDCGCYGKLMKLSPAKSVGLDAIFALLTIAAWKMPSPFALATSLQIEVLVVSAALFAGATIFSHRRYEKSGRDLWDLNPLKVNRRWRANWLQGYAAVASKSTQLIVLMSPTCPACKQWVKPLNRIAGRPDMPQVIAGMAAPAEEIDRVIGENGIGFPVLQVQSGVMAKIADLFPILVVVENGVVRSKDTAKLPQELIDRLKGGAPALNLRREPGAATLRPMPDPA